MSYPSRRFRGAICLFALFVAISTVSASVAPGEADLLNINGALDLRLDATVSVAAGQSGRLVAVWESHENIGGAIGTEPDILFAVSDDHGEMWTFPAPLNSDAATDGTFTDQAPHIATDGAGVWVVVWQKTENVTGIGGANWDIYYTRSTDNGLTWSAAAPIHSNAGEDTEDDEFPSITTDRDGNWVVVWQSEENVAPASGFDREILLVRSSDDGATWSAPAVVNTNAGSDTANDDMPAIVTDANGVWICAWESNNTLSNTVGPDLDVLFARSTDNGVNWSDPALLNANGTSDFQVDEEVALAFGDGVWLAVWQSNDQLQGTIGQDRDVLAARSLDGGLTWGEVVIVNTTATTDSGIDDQPHIATDGAGNWIATWRSDENIGGTVGDDLDIFCARSTDDGSTWTDPILVNSYGTDALSLDWNPCVVNDGAGNWLIAWDAGETALGTDRDIWRATFFLGSPFADLGGVVVDADTLMPLVDAAVVATPSGGGEIISVTDRNGRYRMLNVPEGAYTLDAYAPGYTSVQRTIDIGGGETGVRNFRIPARASAGQINGVATDSMVMRGVGGAQITATVSGDVTDQTYTGAEGAFSVSVIASTKAPVAAVLEGTAPNYIAANTNVDADTESEIETTLTMTSELAASASLSGIVTLQGSPTPIAGARITAIGPIIWAAISGGDGSYLFNLPPGEYRLEASADDYTGVQTQLNIVGASEWNPVLTDGAPVIDFRDVNNDGVINAVDVQNVINAALGSNTAADTDINGDNLANAVDVQLAINGALGIDG